METRSVWLSLLFFTSCVSGGEEYLTSETLGLPLNATAVKTQLPLDPGVVYTVRISSRYHLAALCSQAVLFDGHPRNADSPPCHKYDYLPAISFYLRGTGRPLSLQLAQSFTHAIGAAQVEIYPKNWAFKWYVIGGLLFTYVLWVHIIYPTRKRRRQEEERQRQEKERLYALRQQQKQRQEKVRKRLKRLKAIQDQRLKEEKRQQEEREQAARERQEQEEWQHREQERQREEEEERRYEQEQKEHKRQQEIRLRLQQLTDHFQYLEHYQDESWIEQHAKANHASLLERRDDILATNDQLHQDAEFVQDLQTQAPDVYARATWEVRALACAEKIAVESPPAPPARPPKKRLTAEEIRAIKLRRQQAQIGDKIILTKNRIEAILQVRKEMDQYDLEPDERDQIEAELIESILDTDQEDNHGPTKTL